MPNESLQQDLIVKLLLSGAPIESYIDMEATAEPTQEVFLNA